MAARTTKIRHDDETRAKIQVGNIINRLQKGFNGEVELSAAQIKIADILLRKVLPDMTSVEHSGEVATSYVARMPSKSASTAEWQKQHALPTIQ